jgi:hypothetical protein
VSARVEVYRTPVGEDARVMSVLLEEEGIPCEMGLVSGAEGPEAVLTVAAENEEQAVRFLSERLEERGMRPEEGAAELTGGAACPNCGEPVPMAAGDACAECGYAVHPPAEAPSQTLGRLFPDAKTCCPDCCAPSTREAGACPDCGTALEALDRQAPACPARLHMLVKGEGPGWVCPGCRAAWLDA